MINKIYKRIHNKYSPLLKFIFYLRYLIGIFFISSILFLIIPYFFDLKKKEEVIKNYLLDEYGLSVNKYESIKYKALPTPNLEIKKINASLESESLQMNMDNLNIYIKLLDIYDSSNFKANKVVIKKGNILLLDSNLKSLVYYIHSFKNKLTLKNLNLKVTRIDAPLINIEKINFSNYGYNKNIFTGKLFDKNFKIIINDNYTKINFKLLNTGISAEINFNEINEKNKKNGIFKSKFLNSNLKFYFNYDEKKLKIYNSNFRNKNLSFKNESTIIYHPFFYLNSVFKIEDVNISFLKGLNLNKILKSKNFIKKINTDNEIIFKSNKFSNNLIDDLHLSLNLAYGRATYSKKILFWESIFTCKGDMNLLEEYPVLYFDCSVTSKNKKKFLKKLKIKHSNQNGSFKLNTKGNINILSRKINFQDISVNNDYKASKDDLNYFKHSFENILFDKDFISIFNLKKIKDFIIEIS
jgi:hypothetical protein